MSITLDWGNEPIEYTLTTRDGTRELGRIIEYVDEGRFESIDARGNLINTHGDYTSAVIAVNQRYDRSA